MQCHHLRSRIRPQPQRANFLWGVDRLAQITASFARTQAHRARGVMEAVVGEKQTAPVVASTEAVKW